MQKKVTWIEYAKAIGIILVVYGHVARGVYTAGLPIDENLFQIVDRVIYSFHMPLFFFLSGLFLITSLKKWGRKNFVLIKASTVAYPYLVWSILQGSIEVYMNSYTNQGILFSDVLTLFYQPRAQFWFLYALFTIFVFSALLYQSYKDKVIMGIFVFSLIIYIFRHNIPTIYGLNFFTGYFVYFAFGAVCSKWINSDFLRSKTALFSTLILFVLGQYLFINYTQFSNDPLHNINQLILVLISIAFIMSLAKNLPETPMSLLLLIGQSSFSIYILHVIFGSGARIILVNIFNISSLPTHLIFGCMGAIFAPLAITIIINKYRIGYIFSFPTKISSTKKD